MVRKKMWWKDMKMRMCLIAGVIILLCLIIIPAGMFTLYGSAVCDQRPRILTWCIVVATRPH
jgi:hypothetical protein